MYIHISQPDAAFASPPPSKKRKKQAKHSFCQGLALRLDKADYRKSSAYFQSLTNHNTIKSPLIALPPEPRQEILCYGLDDDTLMLPPMQLAKKTKALALVCKTSHADTAALMSHWRARRDTLQLERGVQRGAFDSLIADFMAPVTASGGCVETAEGCRYS